MSGALCDAMLESNHSFDELEALAKYSNLFLVPLDDDGIGIATIISSASCCVASSMNRARAREGTGWSGRGLVRAAR